MRVDPVGGNEIILSAYDKDRDFAAKIKMKS